MYFTLGHYWGSNLIYLILITAFLSIFEPKVTASLVTSPFLGAPMLRQANFEEPLPSYVLYVCGKF